MGSSFKIGKLFGITVRLHVVFVLLFALLVTQVALGRGSGETLAFSARLGLLFTFVLLHELGHSLIAQAHGIRVYDIVLWPLGGLARLERIPEDAKLEFKIAIGGPLVNFLLVLLFLPVFFATGHRMQFDPVRFMDWSLVEYAVYMNLLMGTFNLVPAFPLDGGRVLRALLARQVDWLTATRAAVHVGRCFALVGGLAAIASPVSWSIVLIAVFVWFSGAQELRVLEAERAARREAFLRATMERSPAAERFLGIDPDPEPLDAADRPGPTAP